MSDPRQVSGEQTRPVPPAERETRSHSRKLHLAGLRLRREPVGVPAPSFSARGRDVGPARLSRTPRPAAAGPRGLPGFAGASSAEGAAGGGRRPAGGAGAARGRPLRAGRPRSPGATWRRPGTVGHSGAPARPPPPPHPGPRPRPQPGPAWKTWGGRGEAHERRASRPLPRRLRGHARKRPRGEPCGASRGPSRGPRAAGNALKTLARRFRRLPSGVRARETGSVGRRPGPAPPASSPSGGPRAAPPAAASPRTQRPVGTAAPLRAATGGPRPGAPTRSHVSVSAADGSTPARGALSVVPVAAGSGPGPRPQGRPGAAVSGPPPVRRRASFPRPRAAAPLPPLPSCLWAPAWAPRRPGSPAVSGGSPTRRLPGGVSGVRRGCFCGAFPSFPS